MNSLFKMTLLCLAAWAITGCNERAKPDIAAHVEEPFEIQGYKLGLNERSVVGHGGVSCQNPKEGKVDADRICTASISVSEQPALMYFYFYNDSLRKLSMTILPMHGKLPEVSKTISEALKAKYGKPSAESASRTTWSHGHETIVIGCSDERTMTVNLTSEKYEDEKMRRAKMADGKVEI